MKTHDIKIREVKSDDIHLVQEIGKRTFKETFEASNSAENMQEYLDNSFSISKLENELSDQNSLFYFALFNEKVVGYLKVNWRESQTENSNKNALEIERIYVLKEFHGMKVGQVLYEKAIEISVQKDVEFIWLGVWEENPRAIRFYKKNGFTEFDKHVFQLGDDKQTDIMMKRPAN
ncbi:GNAT family N-acetyltransferase [Draconibacterium halophilum]|uniref:GNAT family N-acetyltransferase n=1 Tax=Draconibacterium halophilum TaxID=2706887 RepID=A0A6C0RGL7_9BACT|nr:GNAT family N-acetyltransferase [Draconibacterium halophilum]QIA09136.1 GNAT family N-acetyltransferase [Draconibacterium halophilum]